MEEQAEYVGSHSTSIKELAVDFIKAQAEMHNPAFDAVNPHFKSKYASLSSVRSAVIPVFNKHNFGVVQFPFTNDNGDVGVDTMLLHVSGEWLKSSLTIKAKQDAHGAGSAITYARRYALQAMAGVVGDDDDDGNAALPTDKEEFIDKKQLSQLKDYVDSFQQFDEAKFLQIMGAKSLEKLPAANFQKALAALKSKAEKEAA